MDTFDYRYDSSDAHARHESSWNDGYGSIGTAAHNSLRCSNYIAFHSDEQIHDSRESHFVPAYATQPTAGRGFPKNTGQSLSGTNIVQGHQLEDSISGTLPPPRSAESTNPIRDAEPLTDPVLTRFTPVMDHRGSIVKLLDSTGAVAFEREYDAFGVILSETPGWPTDCGYQTNWRTLNIGGKILCVSAARVYDPETGRFLSRDPLVALCNIMLAMESKSIGVFAKTKFIPSAQKAITASIKDYVKWFLNSYRTWSNNPLGEIDRAGLETNQPINASQVIQLPPDWKPPPKAAPADWVGSSGQGAITSFPGTSLDPFTIPRTGLPGVSVNLSNLLALAKARSQLAKECCEVFLWCHRVGLPQGGVFGAIYETPAFGTKEAKIHCAIIILDKRGCDDRIRIVSWSNEPAKQNAFDYKLLFAHEGQLKWLVSGCGAASKIEDAAKAWHPSGVYGVNYTSNTFVSQLLSSAGIPDPFQLSQDSPSGWDYSRPVSPPSPDSMENWTTEERSRWYREQYSGQPHGR